MATLTKNKAGLFEVRATIGTRENNREIRRKFKLQREAKAFMASLELTTAQGGSMAGSRISLTDYFDQWITTYKKGKFSKSTDHWYAASLAYVRDYFGATPLSSITKMQYQEFINYLGTHKRDRTGRALAKTTVSRVNHYVRSILQDAIDAGIIATDFTRRVQITGEAGKKPEEKYLSLGDLEKVLELARKGASLRHMADYVILVQSYTGMRYEEAVGLSWDRIDFEHGSITIDRSWIYKNRVEFDNFGPLKNAAAYRTISMSAKLAAVLRQLQDEQADYFAKRSYEDRNRLVFRNADFRIINNEAANATLRGLCERAETRNVITTHGLRHTHGSILIYDGIDPLSVSKRLGHQDLQTTLSTYVHEIAEMKARDDDRISATLDKLL
ncbi:tyrosine-type recombinase/integrase [Lacticaseibacillus absianus]|uniref:tyrosine-type recombinase/integrase n=1 Tax=Lacticaseibacillus absianus TaxID=2729623 RepID=UPI0015C9BA9C|nr:site-specific integrase [Lacticaseibacillus absianus]